MRKIINVSKLSLLVIIASYSLTSFVNILVITAAPYIKESLQISVVMTSVLLSAYPLGICLGQLFFGSLVDRQGVHKIYLCGSVLLFVACVLSYIWSNQIYWLIAFYFIQALGVAAVILAARVLLCRASLGDSNKLARFYSLEYFSSVASGAISPLIALGLILYFLWESIFLFSASAALFFTITFRMTVYSLPGFDSLTAPSKIVDYHQLLDNRNFVKFTLVGAMTYVWMYTYFVAIPYLLKFFFLVSTVTYGSLMTLFLFVSLGAALSNMVLLSFWSIRTLLLASIVATFLIAVTMIFFYWLDVAVFYFFVLLVTIMSFTVTVAMTEAMTLALSSCKANETGKATGLFGFFVYAVGFATTILAGYILDLPYNDLLSVLVWLAGTALVTLFLCWWAVKPQPEAVKESS